MRSVYIPMAMLGVTLSVGCAHERTVAVTETSSDEVVTLRRDNAALRRRIQMLEDRVLKLEHVGVDTPGDLPVVRLEPPRTMSPPDDVSPPRRTSRARTLSPVPGSAPLSDPAEDDAPRGDDPWVDPLGYAPAPASTDDPASGRSYRLVGTRLVELTQQNAPKGPDRPARDRKGNAIVAQYEAAMAKYKAGSVAEAEQAFEQFARAHPKHDYADNALYWKGEASYDQRHYADALASFTEVVERYGGGNKASDALLKIGLCYLNLGDVDNARDVFTHLTAAYPQAQASDIARVRLAEIES